MTASEFSTITLAAPATGQTAAPATQIVESGASVLVYNTSTTTTVYLTDDNSRTSSDVGAGTLVPMQPQSTIGFDGSVAVYAVVATGQTAVLNIYPGSSTYAPGALSISGTPSVGISGVVSVQFPSAQSVNVTNASIPTTVSGTVNTNVSNNVSVQNTSGGSLTVAGSVNIGNTPNVNITGTPTVTVASGSMTLTGTNNVTVSNASLNVIGAGGFILPGQLTALITAGSHTLNASTSVTIMNGVNVASYSSLDFTVTAGNGSTTTGTPYTLTCQVIFVDSGTGNVIGQYTIDMPLGGTSSFSVPCSANSVIVQFFNNGTGASVSFSQMVCWGSYRTITTPRWNNYIFPNLPSNDATITWGNLNEGAAPGWLPGQTITPGTGLHGYILGTVNPGTVTGYYQITNTNMVNNAVVVDLAQQTRGNIIAGTGNSGVVLSIPQPIAATPTTYSTQFPMGTYALVVNCAATSTIQFSGVQTVG